MVLFRNNELHIVNTNEDDSQNVTAVQEDKGHFHWVRDQIWTLRHEERGYIFICTQSPYADDSGLNRGLSGWHTTVGDTIKTALKHGLKVYNGTTQIFDTQVKG